MILFILLLLVVKSYAACPAGQFYLVELKESGSCDKHISQSKCSDMSPQQVHNIAPDYVYGEYSNGRYNEIIKNHRGKYSPGCQVQTYTNQWNYQYPIGTIRYGKSEHEFTGSCANTFYDEGDPYNPYGPTRPQLYNQGGTNCLCAPPGEDDAICVSACPAGTARRHEDDVSWDPCDAIGGCMDDQALNYNPNANKDDGSCEYCHIENGEFFLVKSKRSGSHCSNIGLSDCTRLVNPPGDGYLYNAQDKSLPYGCNVYSSLWGDDTNHGTYNTYSSVMRGTLPCGYFEGADPICDCDFPCTTSYNCQNDVRGCCIDEDDCILEYPENRPSKECNTDPRVVKTREQVPEYDMTCLCMPDGETELQCVAECPEEPLYNIEKIRRYRENEAGVAWDGCSVEIEGCPNPLFKEYNSTHTAHAPYLIQTEDGSTIVNPIACQTLTCETLNSGFDNYCLPEGEC